MGALVSEIKSVAIGLDIGNASRHTGVCVVEAVLRRENGKRYRAHFLVRHLERLAPRTSYPSIAQRVEKLAILVEQRYKLSVNVFINVTGFGEPVHMLFRERITRAGIDPVCFNHGDRRGDEGDYTTIGKAFLVSRLQVLLQTGCLHLAETAECRSLADDLLAYDINVSEIDNDRPGAFSVGSRDELVNALGLATLNEPARPIKIGFVW